MKKIVSLFVLSLLVLLVGCINEDAIKEDEFNIMHYSPLPAFLIESPDCPPGEVYAFNYYDRFNSCFPEGTAIVDEFCMNSAIIYEYSDYDVKRYCIKVQKPEFNQIYLVVIQNKPLGEVIEKNSTILYVPQGAENELYTFLNSYGSAFRYFRFYQEDTELARAVKNKIKQKKIPYNTVILNIPLEREIEIRLIDENTELADLQKGIDYCEENWRGETFSELLECYEYIYPHYYKHNPEWVESICTNNSVYRLPGHNERVLRCLEFVDLQVAESNEGKN